MTAGSAQPTQLGKYEIIEELGRGGFGVVYRARDTVLQREVALKVIHPQLLVDSTFVGRFFREAQIAALLKHPNIVVVHDIAEAEGRFYIVMELLTGHALHRLIAQNKHLDLATTASILEQVGAGLDYAHAQGVLHRDVKPSNIVVRPDGHATLTDFGLAKVRADSGLESSGQQVGTLAYMAPEQLDPSAGDIGPWTDIYALGIVAYEMLSGHPPFEGTSTQVISGHLTRQPPPLTGFAAPVQRVLNRALAKSPADRYPTCKQFVADLRAPQARAAAAAQAPHPSVEKAPQISLSESGPKRVEAKTRAGKAPERAPRGPQEPPAAVGKPKPPAILPFVILLAIVLATVGGAVVLFRGCGTIFGPSTPATLVAEATSEALEATTPTVLTAAPSSTAFSLATATATSAPVRPTEVATATGTSKASASSTFQPASAATSTEVAPTPGQVPSATPTARPLPPLVTATPMSVAPEEPPGHDEGVHVVGQPWEQDGVSLAVTKIDVRSESASEGAAIHIWYRLLNKTGQKLLVEVNWDDIHVEDSFGNRYGEWTAGESTSFWVDSAASYDFDRYYSRQPGERSRVPSAVRFVQVVVDRLSRVSNARWRYDINATLVPIAAPDPGAVKEVGQAWEREGLALTLRRVEVRAESDSEGAAARVWFELVNRSNDRLLVEIDYSNIYLIDSYGVRFNDYSAGGLESRWLDAGGSWEFDRYYTRMAGERSRVTRGASFVLVMVRSLGWMDDLEWQCPIIR